MKNARFIHGMCHSGTAEVSGVGEDRRNVLIHLELSLFSLKTCSRTFTFSIYVHHLTELFQIYSHHNHTETDSDK